MAHSLSKVPQASEASPLFHPPALVNQPTPGRDIGHAPDYGQRFINNIIDGKPQRSPSEYAALLSNSQSSSMRAGLLRQLQSSYGNNYVGAVIQAQLGVSGPGDFFEQEADRVIAPTQIQPQEQSTPEPHSVINSRIDVRAQFALLRLFKGSPQDAKDATDLFNDVSSEKIKGIYGDDLTVAAMLAGERGTVRWELVPRGEDAVLLDDQFSNTPVIIFRESAGQRPRLDLALLDVYRKHKGAPPATKPEKKAPPSFKLPPKPKPPSPSCTYQIGESLTKKVSCSSKSCGGGISYDVLSVTATGPACPPTLDGKMYTEVVVSDSGCVTTAPIPGQGCPIGPGGVISACRDTYRLCFPKDMVIDFNFPRLPCTQRMTQTLFVDGVLVKTRVISFTVEKIDFDNNFGIICPAEVTTSN